MNIGAVYGTLLCLWKIEYIKMKNIMHTPECDTTRLLFTNVRYDIQWNPVTWMYSTESCLKTSSTYTTKWIVSQSPCL